MEGREPKKRASHLQRESFGRGWTRADRARGKGGSPDSLRYRSLLPQTGERRKFNQKSEEKVEPALISLSFQEGGDNRYDKKSTRGISSVR